VTVTLPTEQGIADIIMDNVVALLTEKLQTDIDETDASRLRLIKVGPKQDDPEGVDIMIHENNPDSPGSWPHRPVRYKTPRPMGGFIGRAYDDMQSELRTISGYELVGGGSQMAYAFTAEIEIWGDEIPDIDPSRRDVGQLASIVEQRTKKALQDAGPAIGTGARVVDDFGNAVARGPFYGDAWTSYGEGEALIVRKYMQFYYVCSVSWSTDAW